MFNSQNIRRYFIHTTHTYRYIHIIHNIRTLYTHCLQIIYKLYIYIHFIHIIYTLYTNYSYIIYTLYKHYIHIFVDMYIMQFCGSKSTMVLESLTASLRQLWGCAGPPTANSPLYGFLAEKGGWGGWGAGDSCSMWKTYVKQLRWSIFFPVFFLFCCCGGWWRICCIYRKYSTFDIYIFLDTFDHVNLTIFNQINMTLCIHFNITIYKCLNINIGNHLFMTVKLFTSMTALNNATVSMYYYLNSTMQLFRYSFFGWLIKSDYK